MGGGDLRYQSGAKVPPVMGGRKLLNQHFTPWAQIAARYIKVEDLHILDFTIPGRETAIGE
jgi:hypothetical protein